MYYTTFDDLDKIGRLTTLTQTFTTYPKEENCKTKEEILIYMLKKLRTKGITYIHKVDIIGTAPKRKAQAALEYLAHNEYIENNHTEYDKILDCEKISPHFWGLTEKGRTYAESLYRNEQEKQGYKWK